MLSRTEAFAVHGYEVDAFGTLAVPALSGYLSEVAGLHAADLGVGLEALRARGLTWVLARATTQWLVLDVARRKPVRPADVLDPRFPREPREPAVPLAPGKLPELRGWEREKRFHVRYADIDGNLHVTNTTYVAWAMEAVPRELWQSSRVASVEVAFLAETHHGAAILSRLARTGDAEYAHAIVREEDGKELARLVTAWVPREAAAAR